MARTSIDLCNAALSLIGANQISSLSDNTREAEACSKAYELTVGASLTVPGGSPMRWSFATRQESLAALADVPVARWAKAWALPDGSLMVHAITSGDAPIVFDIMGDGTVLTDEHDAVVCDHTYRPAEALWPAPFANAFVYELAAVLAMALNENRDLAKTMAGMAAWPGARNADSQQHTAHRLRATRLTSGRFGGRFSGGR